MPFPRRRPVIGLAPNFGGIYWQMVSANKKTQADQESRQQMPYTREFFKASQLAPELTKAGVSPTLHVELAEMKVEWLLRKAGVTPDFPRENRIISSGWLLATGYGPIDNGPRYYYLLLSNKGEIITFQSDTHPLEARDDRGELTLAARPGTPQRLDFYSAIPAWLMDSVNGTTPDGLGRAVQALRDRLMPEPVDNQ